MQIQDFGAKYLMPGIIDLNVNTQALASKEWESFTYATSAAATGGVTTIVDMPIMKKPSVTSASSLKEHVLAMENQLKIDSVQLGYMTQEHLEELPEFLKEDSVFGFYTSFQQPLNRKLGTVTDTGFETLVRKVSCHDPNMLIFVEAMKAEDRHMFAKSPFRKEKRGKRLSCEIPKSLSIMGGMAFADDNKGDSSASEDEAKGYELCIDRLNSESKFKSGALLLPNPNRKKTPNLELNSATIRTKIKEMRDDISKLAESELLMYEQNQSKEDGSSSPNESDKSNEFHRSAQGMNISVGNLESQRQRKTSDISTKSTPLVSKLRETALASTGEDTSNTHRSTPSKLTIKKEHVHFGTKMRRPTGSITTKGIVKEEPNEDSSPVVKSSSTKHGVLNRSPLSAQMDLRKACTNITEEKKQENFSNQAAGSNEESSLKVDSLKIERTRPTLTVSTFSQPSHQRKTSLRDQKPSPLTGASGKNSFMERRKQLLQQKNSGSDVMSTETNGSGLTPVAPPLKTGVSDDSPQFGKNLMPLNTKKADDTSFSQEKLQQSYKFFLSMNTTCFEENGVNSVNSILQSIDNFTETGCKIHFTVLSTNKCFDKIRDLKKKHPGYQSRISYEITAHHLYFTEKDIQDRDVIMKCSPPIRDDRENFLFALSFRKRYFDAVTSAHFPVSPEYKFSVNGNFLKAFSGVSTLGFSLQALWTLFNDKKDMFKKEDETIEEATKIFFQGLVYALSERPAQVLGIDKRKGTLAVGKQCDFLVFDPDQHYVVEEKDVYSRFTEISIYKGKTMYGRITDTYLGGKHVFCKFDSDVLQSNFLGRVLKRSEYRHE